MQLLPLEHLSLSLVLGLLASSLVYWATMFAGVPALFLLWPLTAAAVCAYRASRHWMAPIRWRLPVDESHLLLLGVLAVVVALLGVDPIYYRNMTLQANGELDYRNLPDLTLHLAIANELTHAVPPQVPFIAGHALSYHYAPDLPAAFFSAFAGLNTLDLTVRFMPTFFFVMSTLAIFSFSRAWLQSGRAAALATILVILGEDLAFVPGLWFRSQECWSAQYFGVPSSMSLYFLNPMLPALGVLFAGLFCFLKFFRDGGKRWLLLTALLFAAVLEYKVFIAVQVILVLFLVALVYLIVHRDRRPLALFLLTALFLMFFALPMWYANASGADQTIRLHHTTYLPEFVRKLGLADTKWGHRVIDLLNGGPLSLKKLAACLLIVLPAYLVGSLGARLFGLSLLVKQLWVPTLAPRFFLALFVFVGPLLTLTCVVVSGDKPLEMQYNNSSWFFIQSKYLAWIFAVECLCSAAWLRRRGLAGGGSRPATRSGGPRLGAVLLVLQHEVPALVPGGGLIVQGCRGNGLPRFSRTSGSGRDDTPRSRPPYHGPDPLPLAHLASPCVLRSVCVRRRASCASGGLGPVLAELGARIGADGNAAQVSRGLSGHRQSAWTDRAGLRPL